MARFFRLLLVVLFLIAGLIVAVRVIGAARPSPLAALFSNPDGSPCKLPCLFGIRPGETRADDALAMLDTHPLARQLDVYRKRKPVRERQPQLVRPTIALEVTPDNLVDSILLVGDWPYTIAPSSAVNHQTLALATASIGDAFAVFGQSPVEFQISAWANFRRVNHFWTNWPDSGVFVLNVVPRSTQHVTERLDIGNPLWVIEIFAMKDCLRGARSGDAWRPWLGFTTQQRYLRSQEIVGHYRYLESNYFTVNCRETQTNSVR